MTEKLDVLIDNATRLSEQCRQELPAFKQQIDSFQQTLDQSTRAFEVAERCTSAIRSLSLKIREISQDLRNVGAEALQSKHSLGELLESLPTTMQSSSEEITKAVKDFVESLHNQGMKLSILVNENGIKLKELLHNFTDFREKTNELQSKAISSAEDATSTLISLISDLRPNSEITRDAITELQTGMERQVEELTDLATQTAETFSVEFDSKAQDFDAVVNDATHNVVGAFVDGTFEQFTSVATSSVESFQAMGEHLETLTDLLDDGFGDVINNAKTICDLVKEIRPVLDAIDNL